MFPAKLNFKLSAHERTRRPFHIVLPFDANSGDAKIRADFAFHCRQNRIASAFTATSKSAIKISSWSCTLTSTKGGRLIVDQRMINHSPELVDFKCLLRVDGRRTQKMQVFRLGGNFDVQTYIFSNGEELVGRNIWLRAEETQRHARAQSSHHR